MGGVRGKEEMLSGPGGGGLQIFVLSQLKAAKLTAAATLPLQGLFGWLRAPSESHTWKPLCLPSAWILGTGHYAQRTFVGLNAQPGTFIIYGSYLWLQQQRLRPTIRLLGCLQAGVFRSREWQLEEIQPFSH